MAVTGLKSVDFVLYTKKGITIERISFDEGFFKTEMLPKLQQFYTRFIVAEKFSKRVARELTLY